MAMDLWQASVQQPGHLRTHDAPPVCTHLVACTTTVPTPNCSKKCPLPVLPPRYGHGLAGVGAAATVIMMIVPVTVFVIVQSNVIETMGASGMKD